MQKRKIAIVGAGVSGLPAIIKILPAYIISHINNKW